jgi:DNA-directed RNA polymerase subunit RPC12/RpoP
MDATSVVTLTPLLCPSCGAPVPLGDGDASDCTHCRTRVEIPASYRELRTTARVAGDDHQEAEQLYRALGTPPNETLYRVGGGVRSVVGALSIAGSGFIRIWRVALVDIGPSLVSGDVDGAGLAIFAAIALAPVIVVCGMLYGLDYLMMSASPTTNLLAADLVVGAVLYAMIVVAGLRLLSQERAALRLRLQAELVAQPPPHPGGPALCRACGAALTVATDAVGVRCDYCSADNLVALPAWLVGQTVVQGGESHGKIQEAIGEVSGERVMSGRRAVNAALLGLLIFPVVFFCAEIVFWLFDPR